MVDDLIVTRLREGLSTLDALADRGGANEADTRQHLIDVLVEWLQYDATHVRRELSDRGNRPDYLLFPQPITDAGLASVVIEAKPLGTDFDLAATGDRGQSPNRQAIRYLRDHADSGPSTLGALTDGLRWRLYRKIRGDVARFDEIDLGPLLRHEQNSQQPLEELRKALRRPRRRSGGDAGEQALRALGAALRIEDAGESLPQALVALGADDAPLDPVDQGQLTGRDLDHFLMDWQYHGHAHGPRLKPMQGQQLPMVHDPERSALRVAVVRFQHSDEGVGRTDVARCARIIAAQTPTKTAAVFVWQSGASGTSARLALAVGRRVAMTQPFDPEVPPPSAREAATRMLRLLSKETADRLKLADALDVRPLQRDFYSKIRDWMRRTRRQTDLFADAPEDDHHDILLRHLIRVIFVWILQREDRVPPALFEQGFPLEHGVDDYHSDVLRFLFRERLSTPIDERSPHPITTCQTHFDRIPFLNGSLFDDRPGDDELRLPNEAYWEGISTSATEPGLFDILGQYHWTVDEQRPGEREQTLDPELLSNLFEQLAADPVIEQRERKGATEGLKAPDGAYYTPMDVAAEMAADALAATVRPLWPSDLGEDTLLDLFRDPDSASAVREMRESTRENIARKLESLRCFDPAVGSGAFLLAILQALQSANRALRPGSTDPTKRIVTYQLAGQDINPMAAQITRLRLFVALQTVAGIDEDETLPNLEARIVCADTLYTHPVRFHDPLVRGAGRQMDMVTDSHASDLRLAIRRLAAVREQWPDDHTELAKANRRAEDRDARRYLRETLERLDEHLAKGAKRELYDLADHPMLEPGLDAPAKIDPRLLFAQDEEDWPGFDVVIGNPPYQPFTRSNIDDQDRLALADQGYRTTAVADISALFCEAALALARPDGGVVELVMPLSLSFGRQQRALRLVFEECSRAVNVRHYNVAPDGLFNAHPLFKDHKNRQRATVVTAVMGKGPPRIRTDALLRWHAPDRAEVLRRRPRVELQERDDGYRQGQWPRIPNRAVGELMHAVARQKSPLSNLVVPEARSKARLMLPDVAGYFVSALPPQSRERVSEFPLYLQTKDHQMLVMAALGGHVAFAWWLVLGDAYHVKWTDFAAFTVPDAWQQSPDDALALAKEMTKAIPRARSVSSYRGEERVNVDFHGVPDLIEKLDRLHIEALGLDPERVLPSLHRMRSSNGWSFESDSQIAERERVPA